MILDKRFNLHVYIPYMQLIQITQVEYVDTKYIENIFARFPNYKWSAHMVLVFVLKLITLDDSKLICLSLHNTVDCLRVI